ncbi:hypothetical protein [Yokenella regensburgei]|uniref:hypothetical protein n=1 Tax=Yokenella regensburgei TaxID=158877 RepID=UPI003ED947EE
MSVTSLMVLSAVFIDLNPSVAQFIHFHRRFYAKAVNQKPAAFADLKSQLTVDYSTAAYFSRL